MPVFKTLWSNMTIFFFFLISSNAYVNVIARHNHNLLFATASQWLVILKGILLDKNAYKIIWQFFGKTLFYIRYKFFLVNFYHLE